jgi:hypothetical protein
MARGEALEALPSEPTPDAVNPASGMISSEGIGGKSTEPVIHSNMVASCEFGSVRMQ